MQETMKEMLSRHEEEIVDFQNRCSHRNVSDWMPYMWAPGHFSHNVKVCRNCDKIVDEDKMVFDIQQFEELTDGRCVVEV